MRKVGRIYHMTWSVAIAWHCKNKIVILAKYLVATVA